MNSQTFNEGVALIMTTFPNLGVEKNTVKVWRKLFEDLSDKEFANACVALCRECPKIYPNDNIIAMIRERALDDGADPDEEWLQITRQVWSDKKEIQASDRGLEAFRLMGGRKSIYGVQQDQIPFKRKEFLEIFKRIKGQKFETRPQITSGRAQLSSGERAIIEKAFENAER